MPAATDSVFDVAFWFCDRALSDNEYLQPIKMHYLLYLAQGYHAAANNGKKLVPAIFVADDLGPLEPSVFRAWVQGRPKFEGKNIVSDEVAIFTDSIWRRFGHHSADHLAKLCRKNPAYISARKRGNRAEIDVQEMISCFTRSENHPGVKQVVKPKIMKSHRGHPVEVKNWSPPEVNSQKTLSSKKR